MPKYPRFACAAAMAAFVLGSRLAAQDVTLGDPAWLLDPPAPKSLESVKKGLDPAYPDEMRAVDRIGYATIVSYVAADGHNLELFVESADRPFQRAVEMNVQGEDRRGQRESGWHNDNWEMLPATLDGESVDTFIWLPVIFNPASATVEGPDATPRLLSITPVFVSAKFTGALGQRNPAHVHVSLDAAGEVLKVVPVSPGTERFYWPTIQKAVSQWRFAPARKEGRPVAAEFDLTVLPQPFFKITEKADALPEAVDTVNPAYPSKMQRFGMRGEVTVGFMVGIDGRVRNPVIVESSNPGFNESALDAILQWKFKPAMKKGRPVNVQAAERIIFQFSNRAGGGEEGFAMDSAPTGPKGHENSPARVRGTLDPVYPYQLLCDRVSGKANARMVVDQRGRVVYVQIMESSRPEFGLALRAALEGFRFDPALQDGAPTFARVTYAHTFTEEDLDNTDDGDLLSMDEHSPGMIRQYSQLDRPLKPRSRQAPIFPLELVGKVPAGSATIEFLVNESGHVCLPRIVQATDPAFGYAAMQAAAAWLFEPPVSHGRAANVRVRVPFNFHAPS